MTRIACLLLSLALAGTLAPGATAASAETKIGVAGAVKDDVTGTVNRVSQPLGTGHNIFLDETVSTGRTGTAQLLFLDETTLSIGPQSDVKLDRFVYDASNQSGSVVFQTSKGVLRFISGSQKPGTYQLRTPVATIGFRGTIGETGSYNGVTYVLCEEGEVTVLLKDGTTVVLHPGDVVIVNPDGTHQVSKWENYIVAHSGDVSFPLLGKRFVDDYIDLGADPNLGQDLSDTVRGGGRPDGCVECGITPPNDGEIQ